MSLRFDSGDQLAQLLPELAKRNAGRLGLATQPAGRRAKAPDSPQSLPGVKPPKAKEKDEQAWLLARAKDLGWLSAHFRTSQTADGRHLTAVAGDGKGFPDTVLLRGGRLVVAELKVPGGKVRPEQAVWLDQWRAVPAAEVFLWVLPRDRAQVLEVLA